MDTLTILITDGESMTTHNSSTRDVKQLYQLLQHIRHDCNWSSQFCPFSVSLTIMPFHYFTNVRFDNLNNWP